MSELTIIIDYWGHKELKEYLMALKGILDVKIKNNEKINIYLKYDSNLITPQIIKMEIFLFLNTVKVPSMIGFNKHPSNKTNTYSINIDNVCCEYCFKDTINYLFESEGIERVSSIYKKDNATLNINFNPNLISIEKINDIINEKRN